LLTGACGDGATGGLAEGDDSFGPWGEPAIKGILAATKNRDFIADRNTEREGDGASREVAREAQAFSGVYA